MRAMQLSKDNVGRDDLGAPFALRKPSVFGAPYEEQLNLMTLFG
jgi:hypothetical protein